MNAKPLHRILTGLTVDLIPLADIHTPDVVRLRNSPHVRAFFDEKDEATIESQQAFLKTYSERADDLYWVVALKSGQVIGTNRLNAIDGLSAFKGSQTIDEAVAKLGPYALEAELLILRFAFDILKLKRVRALIRPDNVKTISFNLRLGLSLVGSAEMRGVTYNEYALDCHQFNPAPHDELVSYFAKRQLKT